MLSFRVDERDALEVRRWTDRLGVDRSQLLRDALHRHLVWLAGEDDAESWDRHPLDEGERSLADMADWGPAEDWTQWAGARTLQ